MSLNNKNQFVGNNMQGHRAAPPVQSSLHPQQSQYMNINPQRSQGNFIPQNPFAKTPQQPPIVQKAMISPQAADDNTENALKIAKELADVEIDDTDFDTPAFLRKNSDHLKNV